MSEQGDTIPTQAPVPSAPSVSPIARLFGAASVLALGNIASRVLGFARMRTITSLYGLGLDTDAFFAASKVPTALYNLLIGGQLSAALVPVLSEYAAEEERREDLWRAASVLATAAAAILSVVAIVVYASAPMLAAWLTPAYGPEGVEIVARSLRWMAPAIIVFGLAGVVTGLLLALQRFRFPAGAGAAYNAAMIAAILFFHDSLGVYALPIGVLVGSIGQLLFLLPGLRGASLRPRLDLHHPALRRVLLLYAPIAAGLVITDVVLPTADVRLAAEAGPATRGILDVATQLTQFPHGLIAVAISVAILPALAGSHARGEDRVFARTLSRGARAVLGLSIPAAIGMTVLAEPLVGAVFQSGAFGAADRAAVSFALSAYLIGLPFAAIDWPLNYAFYARQNTWIPALVGVGSVVVWFAVATALGPQGWAYPLPSNRGYLSLALADAAKHIAHALTMLWLVRSQLGAKALEGVARTAGSALIAALIMALVVAGMDSVLVNHVPDGTLGFALRAGIGGLVGVAVYLPLASRLGVAEVGWVTGLVADRMRGSSRG